MQSDTITIFLIFAAAAFACAAVWLWSHKERHPVVKSPRKDILKKKLSAYRIIISSFWMVLWFYLSTKFDIFYTWFIFAILAYFTGKHLFFSQCEDALFVMSRELDYWDFEHITSLLELHALDHVKHETPLYDPYYQVWDALLCYTKDLLLSDNYKKSPDYLTSDGESLLKIYIALGTYGVSHDYLSNTSWEKKLYDLASSLCTYENARSIFYSNNFPESCKRPFEFSRYILYQDIYPQLVSVYHSLKNEFPSPVWEDIPSAPYPCFYHRAADIKELFCSCADMTAEEYILKECRKWCYWHNENYPAAFKRSSYNKLESCNIISSLEDIKNAYVFLKNKH